MGFVRFSMGVLVICFVWGRGMEFLCDKTLSECVFLFSCWYRLYSLAGVGLKFNSGWGWVVGIPLCVVLLSCYHILSLKHFKIIYPCVGGADSGLLIISLSHV